MEIKDIIALANAGFSKEEIERIAASSLAEPAADPAPAPDPSPAPASAPAPDPAPAPAPAPALAPAPEPAEGVSADQMLAEILGLKKLIQENNINNSQMPAQLSSAQQADAALASIINPNRGGNKNACQYSYI